MSDIMERLGHPCFVVAPMVDASELAWRILSRRHGAHLCYTPMLHSNVFVRDSRYRNESLVTCEEDRPLIVQFCGNSAQTLLKAGLLAEEHCDAIDINLGCPQAIARRGRYGSFLQDDWKLLHEIVSTLHNGLNIPVTCKVRVFESVEKTVAYAKMLETAGCQMLTVHGRTKEQKGPLTGIASWEHIRAVRENVKIPVVANGNIQCLADVYRCLEITGCHAVMSAEGNLYNPAIFEGLNPPVWEIALEYLNLTEEYPCPKSYIRGHLFKLLQHCLSLPENNDLRSELGKASTLEEFREMVEKLKERYLPYQEGLQPWNNTETEDCNLNLPPWLCQVYMRIPPEEHIRKLEEKVHRNADLMFDQKENTQDAAGLGKRTRENSTENGLSKKKLKKLQRRAALNFHCRREVDKCLKCPNPKGLKCEFKLCKSCCRVKCFVDIDDCPSHRILIKKKREKAQQLNDSKMIIKSNNNDTETNKFNDINIQSLRIPDSDIMQSRLT